MNLVGYSFSFVVLAVGLVGCAGVPDGPQLVPVKGMVTLNGRPVSGAMIMLYPTGDTRGSGASARTDSAGMFELKSPPRGAGAVPGEYKVTVSKLVMPDGSDFPEFSEVSPMDSGAKEQLGPQYSDLEQTALTTRISEGSGELIFALVSP